MVAPALDHLLQESLLTQEQYDYVRHRETNQEKMRALYLFIRGWSNQDKDIVYNALKDGNPGVIENLEGRQRKTTRGDRLSDLRRKHMESIEKDFQRIKEHNARRGETVSLQERYTPLIMRKGYPDRKHKEREISHRGSRHTEAMEGRSSDEYSPITLNVLFDPEEDGFIPMVVVLHGPAGIGKTWTSRKIMLDWASGDFYPDKFDFVFYLSCRELNTISGEISLVRLLSRSSSLSPGDLMFILTDPGNHGRLLFVIDGFDEFRWTLGEKGTGACQEFSEETHKETLLGSLLRKHLLNPSSLLITTRSLAQEKLSTFIDGSRDIEVKGFSGKDRIKYFMKSFMNKAEARKAFRVIKGNRLLLTMCSVPILCWIVCTVLRQEMKKGLDFLQYKTTTPIYLLYLQGLIIYHGRKQPVLPCLKKLCALANEGILDQKILFEEEDLERLGLSVSEVESVFLNENIFQVSIINQTCYSFIHLSMQEFLAAVHYVLDDGDEGERRGEASLPEICKGGSLPELCKDHSHLSLAVRFLFGLLYEKRLHEFSKSTGCKMSFRVRPAVEEWVTRDSASSALGAWIMRCGNFPSIDVISCLYETQDEDLIRRALPRYTCLELDGIWEDRKRSKSDKKQLCYCLKLCECPLSLSINWDQIYSSEHKMIVPLLLRCQRLCIYGRILQRRSSVFLFTEKKREMFSTSEDDNDDMDGKPADLSWLMNPQSRIEELRLQQCPLSPLCCDYLYRALIINRSITKLHLSKNRLEDSGLKRLCEGLGDTRCTLQELSLCDCSLSSACCDDLRSTLTKKRSLAKLDLSRNRLEDSGLKRLCEGLRESRSALQELSLCKCNVSPACFDDLHSLVTNRSLTKLDLSLNHLEDSGVKRLCEWLREPSCTLQELRFYDCGATFSCCEDLISVITASLTLTYLQTSLEKRDEKTSEVNSRCEELQRLGCFLGLLPLPCGQYCGSR